MCNLAKIGKKKGVDPSLDSDSEWWVMTLSVAYTNPFIPLRAISFAK